MRSKSGVFRAARQLSRTTRTMSERLSSYWKLLLHSALGGALYWGLGLPASLAALGVFGTYLLTGGWEFAWVVFKTLPRDFRGLIVLIRVQRGVRKHLKNNDTIPMLFDRTVKRYPDKPAFIYEEGQWTYRQVDEFSNAVANYFYEAGYRKGDVVSIYMENRPEFACFWIGLSKIGVVSSLMNFNLRGDPLFHCLDVSKSKAVIFGAELAEAMKEVQPRFKNDIQFFCTGPVAGNDIRCIHIDSLLKKCPTYPPPSVPGNFKDKLIYIYTSGTTGLPKAAVITHIRFFYMSMGIRYGYRITSDDIIYTVLPLYHTAGGVLGMGNMLLGGTTLVIRKKFSASRFWDDCVKYNCTIAQYIGEICRYLMAQPVRPSESQHRVRLMFGNGLRPQLWREFQARFGVKQMGEFYGATEGNASVINTVNKVGAVGFTTRILPFLYPITLIRVDEATGEPLRDRNGMCILAQPGESGELVGKITKNDPLRQFDGYVCKTATNKKVAKDVFRKGDLAFLTGDVLSMDRYGFLYFKDRTGDTFRWKGENVSTSEVEGVISNILKLKCAVVFGVEVPGAEGKAGMVAIADEDGTVDVSRLAADIGRSLPAYARPLFVRIMREMETTGTYKLKKTDLKAESYDPNKVKDRLYYLDPKSRQYQPLTKEVYRDISEGKLGL